MRAVRSALLFTFLAVTSASSQPSGVVWTETTDPSLPAGVRLFSGERVSPLLKAWFINVDLNDSTIAVRPYVSTIPAGKEGVAPFVERVGAFAAVNGGYFDLNTGSSYSTVVYPDEVLAQNVSVLNRSGTLYPVTRSFFGVTDQRVPGVRWIYHFGGGVSDVVTFAEPTQNSPGNPAPVPDSSVGTPYAGLLAGIGGGPALVKAGVPTITYNEEVFFGSGVGYANADPRTAVGWTPNRHVILLVADGRATGWSDGVSLPELAQIMVEIGCSEAMNLDGGGSTQMAVGGTLINRPEGGTVMRAVPTILAVVRSDSLRRPRRMTFEKVIDSGEPACAFVGSGWSASANPGYWGSTPSQIHTVGGGEASAIFTPGVSHHATYELFAWWVSASNRCGDTPFIVTHSGGTDTVRLDQRTNGSKWNSLGTYVLDGGSSESVTVSNAGTIGTYVVADAIRIVSYDSLATAVAKEPKGGTDHIVTDLLLQAYPNPFNATTKITYVVPAGTRQTVSLQVFDIVGRRVAVLADGTKLPGTYEVEFDCSALASGVYFCRLNIGPGTRTMRLLLVR